MRNCITMGKKLLISYINRATNIIANCKTKIFSEYRIIPEVIKDKLTYLSAKHLILHVDAIKLLKKKEVEGVFVEAGCALGGSAIVIAASKDKTRPLFIYDTFNIIPPISDKDGIDAQKRYKKIINGSAEGISGNQYYGYEKNLLDKVQKTFDYYGLNAKENNVYFKPGFFKDTLHLNTAVAFAHIDCDWYDSVYNCLEKIVPWLSKDGIIIVDDYYAYIGCRDAVNDYFKDKLYYFQFHYGSRLTITRRYNEQVSFNKRNILVWGATGFSNMGDEAMLAANIETLKMLLGNEYTLIALSNNPAITSELHRITTKPDFNNLMEKKDRGRGKISKRLILLLTFLKLGWNVKRILKGKKLKFLNSSEKEFLLTLSGAEALLIAGGGNITDVFQKGGLIARSFTSFLVKLLNKSVFLGAQTIGPLDKKWTRLLTKYFLNKVDLVTLRENYSNVILKDIGVKKEKIKVVPDDAFCIKPEDRNEVIKIFFNEGIDINKIRENKQRIIGVTPRAWGEWKKGEDSPLKSSLEKFIKLIASDESNYIIFTPTAFYYSFGDDDAKTAKEIIAHTEVSEHNNIRILSGKYNWRQLKGIFGFMDVVLGTSYHALVFTLSMGVPAIGIYADEYYRLKIGGLFDLMGFRELAIDARNIGNDELINRFNNILEKKCVIKESLIAKINEIKDDSCYAAKQLVEKLKRQSM